MNSAFCKIFLRLQFIGDLEPMFRKYVRDEMNGAGEGIRTPDPLITNQMLYQLSYAGLGLLSDSSKNKE